MATGDWKDYFYPGTSVLRNVPGIRDADSLAQFERGVTAIRIQELREKPVPGKFDLSHLQEIHKQIFKDVYEWAGNTRTVDMVKGSGDTKTVFTYVENIQKQSNIVKDIVIEANYGRGQTKQEFAKTLTNVYASVNLMHPFREGNGRTTREFINDLSKHAGYELDYSKVSKEIWNSAAIQSARNELKPIREVFTEILSVERAIAFDNYSPAIAIVKYPELDSTFKALSNASLAGKDIADVRTELSKELHTGRLPVSDVTVSESRSAIDHAAAFRNLIVRAAADVSSDQRGEIVAVSSHHALLKVGDMVAVRYERPSLGKDVFPGEKVQINLEQGKAQVIEQNSSVVDRSKQSDMGYDRGSR